MAASTHTASPDAMEERTAPKPKLVIHWWKVAAAVVIGPPILAALAADIANNVGYGLKALGVGGALMAGSVGILFAGLPVLAHAVGVSWRIRVGQVFFALVILAFAAMSYGEQQAAYSGVKAVAGDTLADASSARHEATSARLEANKISEPLPVASLQSMEDSARLTFSSAALAAKTQNLECVQNKRCRDAKTALDGLIERKANAQAKADLLSRARTAEDKAGARADKASTIGTSRVNATAAMVAGWLGQSGVEAEQQAFVLLSSLILLATLAAGLLGEDLLKALSGMITWEDPKPTSPTGRKKQTDKTVSDLIAHATEKASKGLNGFLAKCEMSDKWTSQADIMATLAEWWRLTNQVEPLPSRQKLKAALIEAGFQRSADDAGKRKPVAYNVRLPAIKTPHLVAAR